MRAKVSGATFLLSEKARSRRAGIALLLKGVEAPPTLHFPTWGGGGSGRKLCICNLASFLALPANIASKKQRGEKTEGSPSRGKSLDPPSPEGRRERKKERGRERTKGKKEGEAAQPSTQRGRREEERKASSPPCLAFLARPDWERRHPKRWRLLRGGGGGTLWIWAAQEPERSGIWQGGLGRDRFGDRTFPSQRRTPARSKRKARERGWISGFGEAEEPLPNLGEALQAACGLLSPPLLVCCSSQPAAACSWEGWEAKGGGGKEEASGVERRGEIGLRAAGRIVCGFAWLRLGIAPLMEMCAVLRDSKNQRRSFPILLFFSLPSSWALLSRLPRKKNKIKYF